MNKACCKGVNFEIKNKRIGLIHKNYRRGAGNYLTMLCTPSINESLLKSSSNFILLQINLPQTIVSQ